MAQYLLSVYEVGTPPPPEVLQEIMADVDALNVKIKESGAWVFAGGLHPPETATVVRAENGQITMTDGPFLKTQEHFSGFWIINTPNLDVALEWAKKGTLACRIPVEVRPFQDEPEA
jgi:hypothetical protein